MLSLIQIYVEISYTSMLNKNSSLYIHVTISCLCFAVHFSQFILSKTNFGVIEKVKHFSTLHSEFNLNYK